MGNNEFEITTEVPADLQSGLPDSRTPENKNSLECEKLKAEIHELRKPFYKRLPFYTALSPIVLAALGLLYSQLSGWFDLQNKVLESRKYILQIEANALKERIASLQAERAMMMQVSILFSATGGTGRVETAMTKPIELSALTTDLTNQNSGSFNVADPTGHGWEVTKDVPWITLNAARIGNNGSIFYSVEANPSTNARIGKITVGDKIHTVTQARKNVAVAVHGANRRFPSFVAALPSPAKTVSSN